MKLTARSNLAHLRCRRLESKAPPHVLLEALTGQTETVLLESSAFHEQYGRFSILACRPLEVLCLRGDTLTDHDGKVLAQGHQAVWKALAEAFAAVELVGMSRATPYLPGWIGYIGYETGRLIERLPCQARRDTAFPDLRLAFYDTILVHDALTNEWTLAELSMENPPDGAGLAAEELEDSVASATRLVGRSRLVTVKLADPSPMAAEEAASNFTPEQFCRTVERAVDYIAAGDIFQVNLSQRLVVRNCPPPLAIYRALRRRNPAWHSAYMNFDVDGHHCAVVSSSPELFLRVRDGWAITRPIKGTRPRIGRATVDARAAAELLASPKDNAELAMIIDLMRNDLGRICRYGTISVDNPRQLETHPTVYHLVGTVRGKLRDGVGPAELLRATFPGGSITGAPKIRAMEIIDELETRGRSVYTGCIGIVGVDGRCEWNIAIRTILCQDRLAFVQAGAGIVADSVPELEYQETLHKARALLEAIAQARRADRTKKEHAEYENIPHHA